MLAQADISGRKRPHRRLQELRVHQQHNQRRERDVSYDPCTRASDRDVAARSRMQLNGDHRGQRKSGRPSRLPRSSTMQQQPQEGYQEHEQEPAGVEEESQIVTYGEQYNPATGWIR